MNLEAFCQRNAILTNTKLKEKRKKKDREMSLGLIFSHIEDTWRAYWEVNCRSYSLVQICIMRKYVSDIFAAICIAIYQGDIF